jgi:uncharacterized repeat protein (TIGR03803 family)
MNSHKTDATFLDRIIRARIISARIIRTGRFPPHRLLHRIIRTLSGSLFLGFSAALLFAHPQVAMAQTESVVYSFCAMSNCVDGSDPVGNLVMDGSGNLYGMTGSGGITGGGCQSYGCGTVFERTAAGTLQTLYTFYGAPDGNNPMNGLVRDSTGNLYGTTAYGGNAGGVCGTIGCGIAFELVKAGTTYTEKVLYAFAGGTDGANPGSGLVRDTSGNLYGTTVTGGGSGCNAGTGCGTVFEITSAGNEEVLYSFTGNADGASPSASLILDAAGNLYGTTPYGGNLGGVCASRGCGVVFKVTPAGQETVLYTFKAGVDGQSPMAPLVRDGKGNLYGTTSTGGDVTNPWCRTEQNGCGVVFELTEKGVLRTLYAFKGYPKDGQHPIAGVAFDKQGNLYGTTDWGGSSNDGAVFKLAPGGVETVLHGLTGGTDGENPFGSVVLDAQGNLYGTAIYGGAFGDGVLFKVIP